MRDWTQDQVWIDGGPFAGPTKPHGVVTVEKDWWLAHSSVNATLIVERHLLFAGTARSFQSNKSLTDQLASETVVPGVKTIEIDKSIDTDAASLTLTINNQRLLAPGTLAPTGTGASNDARGVAAPARQPVLGDPGYLTWNRGETATSQSMWGFPNEQPIVYRRFGSADLDFRMFGGTVLGDDAPYDRSLNPGWSGGASAVDDIGDTSDYVSNLFTATQGWLGNPQAGWPAAGGYKAPGGATKPPDEKQGGARAFVTGGESIPDDGRPISGVQVWAMVGHDPTTPTSGPTGDLADVQVTWQPCLKMWDPEWPADDPTYGPGAAVMFSGGRVTTKASTTGDAFISSNIWGTHPVTGEEWTVDTVNALLAGDGLGGGGTDGFGVLVRTNAGADWLNNGTGTGELYTAARVGDLRIYSIWIEIRVAAPPDSWARVLVPNALLRTYQGYGDTGLGLEDNLTAGNLVKTGTWLIDEVHQKSDGELEIRCRDMAKLLLTQRIYPPLVPYDEYPIHWSYDFGDQVAVFNRTTGGVGGGTAGTWGPNTYGVGGTYNAHSGNFRDWTEIVFWHLVWSGWWLAPLTQQVAPGGDFIYSGSPTAGQWPVCYGNLENTNSHPTGSVDPSIFDKQPVMNAITSIKEYVGFLFRIDCDGAARFEPPNFWTLGNFLDDGTHVDPATKMYAIDEEKQLTDYSVSFSDEAVVSEIIIGSNEPTVLLNDTVTTHYLTPNSDLLRGIVRPWAWSNGTLTSKEDQQRMAELVGLHFWFAQRQGATACPANPAIDIDDQVLIFERTTSETTVHYVRGIQTHMDLENGGYTMQLVTNWLGTPEEWQDVADFKLSSDVATWLNGMTSRINRQDPALDSQTAIDNQSGKVTRGGGFTVDTGG